MRLASAKREIPSDVMIGVVPHHSVERLCLPMLSINALVLSSQCNNGQRIS